MKYTRIHRIPFRGNAERCLVLRQLFAMKIIPILSSEKTVWNFDESSLNDSFFFRKMWHEKTRRASVAAKAVTPNISILLAVSNKGDAYISLS